MTKPIVLIGQSGSGKSTVVEAYASAGKKALDLDSEVEKSLGSPIAEFIANQGEAAFRKAESQALEVALTSGAYAIATGGGVVLAKQNRELIATHGFAVWLDSNVDVLAANVSSSHERPLLSSETLPQAMLGQRRDRLRFYFLAADVRLDITGKSVVEISDEVARLACDLSNSDVRKTRTEPVELPNGRGYNVVVGAGILSVIGSYLPSGVKRCAIVTQENIGITLDTGLETKVFHVADGEQAKSLNVVGDLCSAFAQWGLTRDDVVIGLGGGVVTDLAGFAAASYHRGTKVIQVPTTLLGQIDAAIGGKCGVNLPEGKNLVGAFWQPEVVICDSEVLATLSPQDFLAGIGELAKYHFLQATVEGLGATFNDFSGDLSQLGLTELIAACVRMKATVVAADERESGARAILNYGHTLGHAIEAELAYEWKHGLAVGVGLGFAASLAHDLGRIDAASVDHHYEVLRTYGLYTEPPKSLQPKKLLELMARDKKAINAVTFVLDGPDGVETVVFEDTSQLSETLNRLFK